MNPSVLDNIARPAHASSVPQTGAKERKDNIQTNKTNTNAEHGKHSGEQIFVLIEIKTGVTCGGRTTVGRFTFGGMVSWAITNIEFVRNAAGAT